jgi:hypothetical protein
MVRSDFGERMAKVETDLSYIKQGLNETKQIVNDIKVAVLGDGKQNFGLTSRIQALEDSKAFTRYLFYTVISILSTVSGYLIFFK